MHYSLTGFKIIIIKIKDLKKIQEKTVGNEHKNGRKEK